MIIYSFRFLRLALYWQQFRGSRMMASDTKNVSTEISNLPVLDFQLFKNSETRQEFLQKLQHSARNIGFFYLTGHGISQERINEIESISRQFFAQDQALKD